MSKLIYEDLVTSNREAFIAKVKTVSANLGIDPNWLMYVMYKESRLNPAAVNSINGASGLIQFIRSTANGLGTTVEQIRAMSNVAQLDLVERYYRPYKNRIRSAVDLYMATFFPFGIGRDDNWVIQAPGISAGLVARQNPGLDFNRDGQITIAEVKQWFFKGAPQDVLDILQKKNGASQANNTIPSVVCNHCGKRVFLNQNS